MSFENLPGVTSNKLDGNLSFEEINQNPVVLVLGTAAKGPSYEFYQVTRPSGAIKTFGYEGNLTRGIFETYGWGAKNLRAWRYGGTPSTLAGIGVNSVTSGITVSTLLRDDEAGDGYKFYWDNTEHILYVWDDEGYLVYKRDFETTTVAEIDSGLVSVTGTYTSGQGEDIPTAQVPSGEQPVAASGVDFTTPTGYDVTFTDGTDGTEDGGLSYMEKYEEIARAFALLENEAVDYVVPMDVYLDTPNIADDSGAFNGFVATTNRTFPLGGSPQDALGKVFAQEYQGVLYFWWDIDNDGVAEIWPDIGSASATTDAFGETLAALDFRECNFGYQLAKFCYDQGVSTHDTVGVIGCLPPQGYDLASIINWIGEPPTFSVNTNGDYYIARAADNGTGLLGNKFMAGKHNYRSGAAYGGFILTADGFPTQSGSVEEEDANDHLIDIGKYLSVISGWGILNSPWDTTGNGYLTSMAACYAGFDSTLVPGSAATNKRAQNVRLPFQVNLTKLNALSRFRYVMVGRRTKGVVWVDAPTAARPDSDYQRQSTIRTVKSVLNDVRLVCDPFIGEVNTAMQRAALKTQIDSVISRYQGAGLKRGECQVTATVQQEIRGEANVTLVLVPEFELRQIFITMSLAAS